MTLPRPARLALILSPTIALFLAAVWFVAVGPSRHSGASTPDAPPGKLVVLVVFDQMRGDYLDRWASAFGPDGFERMKVDGVWYANARLPYACSSTGPGHASISTGAPPSVHGIVENSWFLRGREKQVLCQSGDEPQRRVPPPDKPPSVPDLGLSPVQLLAPTITDALAAGTDKKGRAFCLSLKDRSAVLLGGKEPAGAYCFDDRDGHFHTSAYYRDTAPPWVVAFNRSLVADTWQGKSWERLLSPDRYESLAGPDAVVGEGRAADGSDWAFPHPLPTRESSDRNYYAALEVSPFGNELLWKFAKTAIVEEELGQKGVPDLLCLSFSSNDLIGHRYGPDSQEVLDITARSDRLVAEMMAFLDERLGRDKYSLVVTADHGVCPLPEVSVKAHPEARRANPGEFVAGLDEALDEAFGKLGGTATWLEKDFRATWPWLYLNRQSIRAAGVSEDEVEKYAEQWIGNRPGVQLAVGRKRLTAGGADLLRSIRLAYHPDRCGDVYVLAPAFVLVDTSYTTGTNHGTPHDYDRHVPVLAVGAGVPRLGRRDEAVNSLVVAPLVCKLLGVAPPAEAKERVPVELSR